MKSNYIVRGGYDGSAITKGLSKTQKQLGGFQSKIGSTMKLVAGSLAIAGLARFGASCIKLGSDLAEVQNVVDVTFGSLSGKVNEFAKTAITQFGMSEKSAKQYTSTMGAMLKSMGLTTEQSLGMSTSMAGLAGDMASFYNLDTDEAFAKIRSGISGETEPLKQLGVNLSVANLQAYAMSQGMTTAYSKMSEQSKALLRYNYLLSVTSDAQGDFARTSGSWANQTRILSEQFNSLKASIGQGLISAFTPIVALLNKLMSKLQGVASAFQSFMAMITGTKVSTNTTSSITESVDATNALASATDGVGDSAKKTAKKIENALSPIDQINKLTDNSTSDSSGGSGSGGSGGGGGGTDSNTTTTPTTDVEENISGISKIAERLKPTIDALKNLWSAIKPLAQAVGEGFIEFCNRLIAIGEKVIPPIINGVANALKNIDPDMVKAVTIALLDVAVALKAIKIGKSVLANLALLKTNLTGLSTLGKIALSVTLAVAAIEWAHIKWEKVFSDSDYEEVNSALYDMFSDAFGEGIVAQAFADEFTGWGAIFSFEYTPKEWTDGFKLWAEDCWKSFKDGWATYYVQPVVDVTVDIDDIFNKGDYKDVNKALYDMFSDAFGEGAFADAFADTFTGWWELISGEYSATEWIDGFKAYAKDSWDGFKKGWDLYYVKPTVEITSKILDKKKELEKDFKVMTKNIIGKVVEFTADIPQKWADLQTSWDGLKNHVKNEVANFTAKIPTKWSDLSERWDSLKKNFKDRSVDFTVKLKTAVGSVKNFVNSLIDAINTNIVAKLDFNVKAPAWLGGKKFGWSAPRIQRLAKGGITNGSTLANIGEAGREAIIPLENNTGGLQEIATLISDRMGNSGGISESSMYQVMTKVFKENMNISFVMGDEEVARHSRAGNASYDRRSNTTVLA